jgi:hypothetical protein
MDSDGVEVGSVWASTVTGGEHGDGNQFGEYGAAAAEVQSVKTVECGSVPDICDVGLSDELGWEVDGSGGGKGVLDVGEAGCGVLPVPMLSWETVIVPVGEHCGQVVETLNEGGGFGVQCRCSRWWRAWPWFGGRHNQRFSRKTMIVSGGR